MRHLLALLLLIVMLPVQAEEMSIHILPRPDAQALVPVISSLLPPGGTVSAYRGKLIIKTTDSNFAELQGALGGLSPNPEAVVVHLRRAGSGASSRAGAEVQIQGQVPGSINGSVRIEQQNQRFQQQDHYQIRALSGYPANISQGTLVTLSNGYYGTALAQLDQGIQVIPQVTSDGSVVLQIQQRYDRPGGPGLAHTQHSATTLRLTPGRWQPMGTIQVESNENESSIGRYQSQQQTLTLPLEVMVEMVP